MRQARPEERRTTLVTGGQKRACVHRAVRYLDCPCRLTRKASARTVLWEMVDASHEFAKNLLIVLSERVRSHNRIIADGYGELLKYERHAKTDALTSLANRHAMQETFPRELTHCVEKDLPVALMMIDVDHFQQFNDMFGHIAGDRALSAVARILQVQFRPHDLLVRYGGDEFAVLLPGTNRQHAMEIGERIRQTVCGTLSREARRS